VATFTPSSESVTKDAFDIAKGGGGDIKGTPGSNVLDGDNVIHVPVNVALGKVVGEVEFDVLHGAVILG
jgi:hypothetical protein